MSKIRVYELAQKLGVDNKVLLDQLQHAGVDAKSHMSVIEDQDLQKLETAKAPPVENVAEERITPGLIRRRRKETAPAEVEAAAVEAPVNPEPATPAPVAAAPVAAAPVAAAPVAAAPAAVAEVATPAPQEPQQVAAQVAEKPAVKPIVEPVQAAASAPVTPKAPVAAAEPPAPAKDPAAVKVTPSRAKILGRVELPQAAPMGGRPEGGRPDSARPAGRPEGQRPEGGRERFERVDRPGGPPRRDGAGPAAGPGRGAPRPAGPGGPGGPASRPSGPGGPASRPSGPGGPASRPSGPGGPASRPSGPGGPGGPGGRPSSPGGRPAPRGGVPVLPAAGDETFAPKEQRGGKKNKKGKGADYSEGSGDDAGRKRSRREVFEPQRGDKYGKGRKGVKLTKKTEITVSKAIKRVIRISDAITVGELAKRMGVKANDLIKELMRQGSMVTINHPLDFETAALLASEFNYEVENVAFDEEVALVSSQLQGEQEKEENLLPRPPVVTIMGHVDHGKTSLLDAIRMANVTAGEAGGITQHIGAYDVEIDGKKISFLDTPGHEAFTAMRARGAKVTDIVILVVAADDGVMPQTKEAINHSKAAGVPIIVAINKMDKPDANPDKVRQELTEFGLVSEDWGGDTIFSEVSAKQRLNLDHLLEMVLLQAEVMDLRANPNKRAKGAIVEARLDKGRGPVATVLVQEGTLRIGDPIVSGAHYGRVRTMSDDRGNRVEEAGPSVPVEVTGLTGVPEAGDTFHAVDDERTAKEVAQHRHQRLREAELAKSSKISLDQLYARIQQGDVKELKVIIKGDVQGSVEAVKDSLLKLTTDACRLIVLHTGVGGITESDITLATASDAIVLGFNVRPETKAAGLAENEGVDIRLYNIIYDAVADIRDAMEGLLAPTLREKSLGRVEIRETFNVSKVGTIAGCYVLDGKVLRGAQVRLVRDNVVVWRGKLSSLKRFKDDAREVAAGYECGMSLENYNDIKVGDIIEVFEMESIKTTL
ncbi:MAG: translation initiation factor IF-2 [Trichloromonadaceae bacterium]